jgi:YbgC/YbaW family acyl-CoA thioester hydrolase
VSHEFTVTVRGYELDSFGHVNNAVYLNYLEQARWEILREKNLFGLFLEQGLILVVIETTIRYVDEASIFDSLLIKTDIHRDEPYLIFKQKIYKNESKKLITKATIKTLLVDRERIPHDIPDAFL